MSDFKKEYEELKAKYLAERQAWNKYKEDVEKWRDQIMKIFSRLKADNQKTMTPPENILALKKQLLQKDEELRILKARLAPPNPKTSNF